MPYIWERPQHYDERGRWEIDYIIFVKDLNPTMKQR